MVNLGQLLSFNISTLWHRSVRKTAPHALNALDYSDIAFQLATTDNLNNLLPSLISQSALQAQCTAELPHYDSLFILTPLAGHKYHVHASALLPPNPQLMNYFESLRIRTPGLSNSQRIDQVGTHNIVFFPLQNRGSHEEAYLVVVFKGPIPGDNHAANLLRPLRNALQKGLQAHQKHQQQIDQAVQQEREAQAADLHDSIAQILSYLKMRAYTLNSACLELEDPTFRKLSKDIEQQIGFAHRLTREMISSSRVTYEEPHLSSAIENTMNEFEQLSGIVFELDNRAKEPLETVSHPNEVLFIVREALCNLVRHSHASHARIVMTHRADVGISITVEDNGIGIRPDPARKDSFGLRIMEERARKLGAKLQIETRQQGGTRVCLRLPRKH